MEIWHKEPVNITSPFRPMGLVPRPANVPWNHSSLKSEGVCETQDVLKVKTEYDETDLLSRHTKSIAAHVDRCHDLP